MKRRNKLKMNKIQKDILIGLREEPYINQRILSEQLGYSLGSVNKSLKLLMEDGYIDNSVQLTSKTYGEINKMKPKRAVILAAG